MSYTFWDALESSGTQYINTGIYPQIGLEIVLDVEFTSTVTDRWLCGAVRNWSQGIEAGYIDGGMFTGLGFSYYPANINKRMTVTGRCTSSTHVTDLPIFLFSRNANGASNNAASCRIYSAKFTLNGTLIADLVPAERDSDGALGMLDNISGNFFTNIGSGAFIGYSLPWYIDSDGVITNNQFITMPDGYMHRPFPAALWRIDAGVNGGIPYNALLPDIIEIIPTPIEVRPEDLYICVYDMETPQNGFDNHGLAVLCPVSCKVTESLNGEYSLTMEHPKDSEGKWQFLREWNIIKALGQLFIINKVQETSQNHKSSISVWAEHITYQLNDFWLFPGSPVSLMSTVTGQDLLNNILTLINGEFKQEYYVFRATTNVKVPEDFHEWDSLSDGATPYAMILGSNGFISRFGGELYRDNFYFSINERMENADDNAFELRIGKNLLGIEKTIDLSTACFYFRGYDNFGAWFAVSWAEATLPRAFPHSIIRSQNFSFEEYNFDELQQTVIDYFSRYSAPLIAYVVDVEDIAYNSDFKMFANPDRLKVGDKGRVWDDDLNGYTILEITSTVTNAITGKKEEVTFGTVRSFTRPINYNPIISTIFTPVSKGGEEILEDAESYLLMDATGNYLVEEV